MRTAIEQAQTVYAGQQLGSQQQCNDIADKRLHSTHFTLAARHKWFVLLLELDHDAVSNSIAIVDLEADHAIMLPHPAPSLPVECDGAVVKARPERKEDDFRRSGEALRKRRKSNIDDLSQSSVVNLDLVVLGLIQRSKARGNLVEQIDQGGHNEERKCKL